MSPARTLSPFQTDISPQTLSLRLVGQHSLWAHHLWNAGRVLANYFDTHPSLVREKNVLELGAGAALPSLIAACNGAEKVLYSFDIVSNILGRHHRLSRQRTD
jgi:EEF1A N-terminal glycine/lysine methyltransferase